MKKILVVTSVLLFSAAIALPVVASNRNGANQGNYQKGPNNNHRDHGYQSERLPVRKPYKADNKHDRDQKRHYEYRHHDQPYQGYRSQPYGRYYNKPHRHQDHEYHYEGHWNSWGDWERYQRIYPRRFHHGGYYHDDGGRLFFRFFDPDGDAYFFYSIGR